MILSSVHIMINSLPNEIIAEILDYIINSLYEYNRLIQICNKWSNIIIYHWSKSSLWNKYSWINKCNKNIPSNLCYFRRVYERNKNRYEYTIYQRLQSICNNFITYKHPIPKQSFEKERYLLEIKEYYIPFKRKKFNSRSLIKSHHQKKRKFRHDKNLDYTYQFLFCYEQEEFCDDFEYSQCYWTDSDEYSQHYWSDSDSDFDY